MNLFGWLGLPAQVAAADATGETDEDRQARLDAEMADYERDMAARAQAEDEGKRQDREAYESARQEYLALCHKLWAEREALLQREAAQRAGEREKRLAAESKARAEDRKARLSAGTDCLPAEATFVTACVDTHACHCDDTLANMVHSRDLSFCLASSTSCRKILALYWHT